MLITLLPLTRKQTNKYNNKSPTAGGITDTFLIKLMVVLSIRVNLILLLKTQHPPLTPIDQRTKAHSAVAEENTGSAIGRRVLHAQPQCLKIYNIYSPGYKDSIPPSWHLLIFTDNYIDLFNIIIDIHVKPLKEAHEDVIFKFGVSETAYLSNQDTKPLTLSMYM